MGTIFGPSFGVARRPPKRGRLFAHYGETIQNEKAVPILGSPGDPQNGAPFLAHVPRGPQGDSGVEVAERCKREGHRRQSILEAFATDVCARLGVAPALFERSASAFLRELAPNSTLLRFALQMWGRQAAPNSEPTWKGKTSPVSQMKGEELREKGASCLPHLARETVHRESLPDPAQRDFLREASLQRRQCLRDDSSLKFELRRLSHSRLQSSMRSASEAYPCCALADPRKKKPTSHKQLAFLKQFSRLANRFPTVKAYRRSLYD